jgi:hypothetical protein
MLSIKEFDTFSDTEKLAFTWEQCPFLMRRSQGYAVTVDLFAANDFFIEVWNNIEHPGALYIRSINNLDSLAPYLKEIDVRDSLSPIRLAYAD